MRQETKQRRTGRQGRPRREDWRLGLSLLTAELGTTVVAQVSWRPGRERATLVAVDEDVITLDVGGELRRCGPSQIQRWRPAPLLEEGTFVVLVGVSRDDWRGVVISTDGFEVEVESTDGFETVYSDELESAWDRPERAELPARKPGPMAADPVVERINTEALKAAREARQLLMGVDANGWAQ